MSDKSLQEQYDQYYNIKKTDEQGNDISEQMKEILEEPYNETDPQVVFEPTLNKPGATKTYVSDEDDNSAPIDKTKWDGIKYPILIINTTSVDPKFIKEFILDLTDIVPSLTFTIEDEKHELEFKGSTGLTNLVTVIMVPQFQGIYRNFALPFYIDSRINKTTTEIEYKCKFRCVGFTESVCEELDSKPINTYNMCYKIAKKCGLGFACTNGCETVSDNRWRQIHGQNIGDYLRDQIRIGGINDQSIFDAWIDTHGYLVLVDMANIFNSSIKAENLMIYEKTGSDQPSSVDTSKEPFECPRTITNYPAYPIKDLVITKHYPYLNTEEAQENGTENSFWCLTDVCGANILTQMDVQIIDNSFEGEELQSVYKFPKIEYLGADMTDDDCEVSWLIQEKVRDSWLTKKRANNLCVMLKEINFGIERGTFINVMLNTEEPKQIAQIKQNKDNIIEKNEGDGSPYTIDDQVQPQLPGSAYNENGVIINPAFTDMYYVNGIKYYYDNRQQRFTQYLFLIKRSLNNPLLGFTAIERVTTEQAEMLSINTAAQDFIDSGEQKS